MVLIVAVAALATAQTASRPEFEAASLKSNPSGLEKYAIRVLPGGKLSAANINLKRLIAVAYSATDFQIFGNINWLESQRFNLEAEAPGPAELNQLRVMLQSLLDERFKLKIHRETRELPIYSLVLAKNKGPGLVEATHGDCGASVAPEPPAANGKPVSTIACGTMNPGPGRISGHRGRISQLADRLSTMLGQTVVDKTGLHRHLRHRPDLDSRLNRSRRRTLRPISLHSDPGTAWTETRKRQGTSRSNRCRFRGETIRKLAISTVDGSRGAALV